MSIQQEPITQLPNDPAFEEINFFSPSSRINRLRYWAHSMLMAIPFYIVFGISAVLAFKVSGLFWGIAIIAYIALIAFSFILIIQRLHDLNKSGWLSLLILVPLANIYLLVLLIFFKGTEGRNTYGLPTPPNKTWHWVLALVFPLFFFVIGILSAIAIPAYQNYMLGAQQQQIQDFDASNGAEDHGLDENPIDDQFPDEEENLDDEESLEEGEGLEEGDDRNESREETSTANSVEAPDPDIIK
jgi:uncharacterized membrane protein YhaH (DUF805 family)